MIQQHVEAQDLEAGTASGVVGEAGVVVVFEDGVSGDQSLYNHVFNVVPQLVGVATDGLQELVQGGQFPTEVNKKRAQLCDNIFSHNRYNLREVHTVCCLCHCPGESSHCAC